MNVKYLIDRAVREYPENMAIIYADKKLKFHELNSRVNQLANALIKLGLKKGDRVGMLLKNCIHFVEIDFALSKTAMVRVPLNTRLTDGDHEYMLNDSGANTLIFGDDFKETVDRIKPQLKTVCNFICVHQGLEKKDASGALEFEKFIGSELSDDPLTDVSGDDLHTIFYTSGTTGKPKGVMLSQKSWANVAINLILDYGPIRENDVLMNLQPLSHGAGFFVLPFFVKGATNVLVPEFNDALIFSTIEKLKVTVLKLVPTILYRLMASTRIKDYDLSALHSIIYGGSPIAVTKLVDAIGIFGEKFVQLYGQAECPMCISMLSKGDHVVDGPEEEVKRLSSAGKQLTNVQVIIVDDDGRQVSHGDIGEVLVKGDHIMDGYWKLPDKTAETLKDGWIQTGDVGYVDSKGYIFLVDRKKDVIISGGFNIYSREIEEAIRSHPKVQDVAVIGVPDEKWGEAVKALVIPKKQAKLTEEEVIEYCRSNLAAFKKPKSVEVVEDLPCNPYGKIQKALLKDQYWRGYDRRIH